MAKYRLYIDEVGDTGLKLVNDPEHRFLSLTGVIAESDYVRRRIHPELEDIKTRYFDSHPDEPVVLHRKELVNGLWPFQALKDADTRAAFDDALLGLIDGWDYRVITVCLDKRAFAAGGYAASTDPYHYCLGAMVETFGDWLLHRGARGDVMTESRGNKEDKKLKIYFRGLLASGFSSVAAEQLQSLLTSSEVKINAKEKNISGLQLADLIAHPSRGEILGERGLPARPLATYAVRIVAALAGKYHRTAGQLNGKRFLP